LNELTLTANELPTSTIADVFRASGIEGRDSVRHEGETKEGCNSKGFHFADNWPEEGELIKYGQ
jgi:hypothetical protein